MKKALDDWFDIMRVGLLVNGRDLSLSVCLPGHLAAIKGHFDRGGWRVSVLASHDPVKNPQAVATVAALRINGGRLQARLGDIDDGFRQACGRGEFFGRSVFVVGGAMLHLAFCGFGKTPGSWGCEPLHFLDPECFPDSLSYRKRLAEIEDSHVAHVAKEQAKVLSLHGIKPGVDGGHYFDTATGNIWKKTAVNTWTFQRDITGPEGLDGTGIVSVSRSGNTVTVTYTDGTTDSFEVDDGADGVTITSIKTDSGGNVTVTYSDASSFTIPAGQAGRGIGSIVRNETTGIVTVTFDDGSTPATFPLSDGMDGEDGAAGPIAWTEIFTSAGTRTVSWTPSTVGARGIWIVYEAQVPGRSYYEGLTAALAGRTGTVRMARLVDAGKDGFYRDFVAVTVGASGITGVPTGSRVQKVFKIDAET